MEKVTIPKVTHLAPFEDPDTCARVSAEFLGRDLVKWRERVAFERENRDKRSMDGEMIKLSDEYIKKVEEFFKKGVESILGMPSMKKKAKL